MADLKSVYVVSHNVIGIKLNPKLQGYKILCIYPKLEFAKQHFEYILQDRRGENYTITHISIAKQGKTEEIKHYKLLKQVSILNNMTKSVEYINIEEHDIRIATSKTILQKIKNYLKDSNKI